MVRVLRTKFETLETGAGEFLVGVLDELADGTLPPLILFQYQ